MMKLYLACCLALLLPEATQAQQNPLVDASWLRQRMHEGDLVLFHIGRETDYNQEHIEGAIFLSSQDYTHDDEKAHIVFDLPADDTLKDLFEAKGLTNQKDVVIYTTESWIPLVTRLYFTLDYLGHGHKTYILDGGLVAWKNAQFETTKTVPKPQKGKFKIRPNRGLLADKKYVLNSIEDENTNIVDCRAQVFYNGIEPTHGARLGRVPTARTIPYTTLYENTEIGAYTFKPLEELSKIFESQALNRDKDLVLYCHIGMQLTVIYTAAKMLGYNRIKIYDGSFYEWGPDKSVPVEVD